MYIRSLWSYFQSLIQQTQQSAKGPCLQMTAPTINRRPVSAVSATLAGAGLQFWGPAAVFWWGGGLQPQGPGAAVCWGGVLQVDAVHVLRYLACSKNSYPDLCPRLHSESCCCALCHLQLLFLE